MSLVTVSQSRASAASGLKAADLPRRRSSLGNRVNVCATFFQGMPPMRRLMRGVGIVLSRRQDDVILHNDDVSVKPENENHVSTVGNDERARPRRLAAWTPIPRGASCCHFQGGLECKHAEIFQAGNPEGPVPRDDPAERRQAARPAARRGRAVVRHTPPAGWRLWRRCSLRPQIGWGLLRRRRGQTPGGYRVTARAERRRTAVAAAAARAKARARPQRPSQHHDVEHAPEPTAPAEASAPCEDIAASAGGPEPTPLTAAVAPA